MPLQFLEVGFHVESIVQNFRNTWFVTNVLPIVTHLEFQKILYTPGYGA